MSRREQPDISPDQGQFPEKVIGPQEDSLFERIAERANELPATIASLSPETMEHTEAISTLDWLEQTIKNSEMVEQTIPSIKFRRHNKPRDGVKAIEDLRRQIALGIFQESLSQSESHNRHAPRRPRSEEEWSTYYEQAEEAIGNYLCLNLLKIRPDLERVYDQLSRQLLVDPENVRREAQQGFADDIAQRIVGPVH